MVNRGLANTLGHLWTRQALLAHNLANAETPNYKRLDLAWTPGDISDSTFARRLQLARTHPRHLSAERDSASGGTRGAGTRIVRDSTTSARNDGNNVDLERELVLLTETSLWYQAANALLGKRYSVLRNVIREGR
ncbi:MAG: flagellar basal body rod protein FlgB [Limnochordales bacterium]|nr:flagellar basal body rod protein FlgB [Limnochordales bacterium]